jgi:hypothetical protein
VRGAIAGGRVRVSLLPGAELIVAPRPRGKSPSLLRQI